MDKLTARGFSTLEVMVAMVIGLMTMGAVIIASFGTQSTILSAEMNAEAVTKAQHLIESAQALGRQDFNLVNNSATTTDGVYEKSVTVELQPDYLTKLITTFVAWKGDHGQDLFTKVQSLVANLENVNSPNTCNSTLSNAAGWKSPDHQVYDFGQLGLNSNNGNGFKVGDIQVMNGILYVAMLETPNTATETFFTFRVPVDPTTQPPVLLDSIDNSTTVSPGLNGITLASTTTHVHTFAANSYGPNFHTCVNISGTNQSCAQLQIFDATDPTNLQPPFEHYKIPTSSPSSVTGSGGQAAGKSIFYRDGYVYLGLTKTASGPEFNVIDVGGGGAPASLTNPVWKGGYSVGNDVNSVFVKGDYAYIATPNNRNLKKIDVKIGSPTFMQEIGWYAPAHAPESEGLGSDHGAVVAVVGNKVYLGRTYGALEFYVLNDASGAMTVVGTKDIATGNQTSVYGLAIRDYLAFMITKAQFQVWDMSTLNNIKPWTVSGTASEFSDVQHDLGQFSSGGQGTALDCEGNYIYTALASTQGNTKDMLAVLYPGAPAFDYTLTASVAPPSIPRNAQSTVTVVVAKVAGTAQPVTVSMSGFQNNVTYAPLSRTCTPSTTCTVTFTVTAPNNAQRVTRTITVAGTVPTRTTTFGFTIL